ncbi:MAG TPA: 3-isopropylmalate dehydrogenase [Candidatus Limnocylindrales bacterium]|jgi:3-isopropylmalate dehydrogenase
MPDSASPSAGTAPAGSTYNLVFVPGDGIGPEVIAAGRGVLEATGRIFGFGFEWHEVLIGGVAIDAYGVPMRDDDLAASAVADAVYFGAIGDPKYDDPRAKIRPEQALLALRKGLGLYANLRPVSVQPVLRASSPVREALLEGVDMMIVRELTGGLYFGRPSEQRKTPAGREVVDTLFYTEAEIRRVVKLAFELARGRRKKLTSVDKANVLSSSRLWRTIVDEMKPEYPDVTVEHRLVDACAMTLIQRPAIFDVLVTENLFGDILSDEASVLAGSLGMLPSASIGERRTAHGLFGLYEPIHGSAPDIAGKDVANPLAAILSGAMMLRWSLGQAAAAEAIERAVASALAAGYRTPDLLSVTGDATGLRPVGTQAMGDAIVAALGAASDAALGAAGGRPPAEAVR